MGKKPRVARSGDSAPKVPFARGKEASLSVQYRCRRPRECRGLNPYRRAERIPHKEVGDLQNERAGAHYSLHPQKNMSGSVKYYHEYTHRIEQQIEGKANTLPIERWHERKTCQSGLGSGRRGQTFGALHYCCW